MVQTAPSPLKHREIIDVSLHIPRERIVEQIVDCPVPRLHEQIVDVVKLIPQKQRRTLDQNVVLPLVEVVQITPQKRRLGE